MTARKDVSATYSVRPARRQSHGTRNNRPARRLVYDAEAYPSKVKRLTRCLWFADPDAAVRPDAQVGALFRVDGSTVQCRWYRTVRPST